MHYSKMGRNKVHICGMYLEANSWNITDGVSRTTETGNKNLVRVRTNKHPQKVVRASGCNKHNPNVREAERFFGFQSDFYILAGCMRDRRWWRPSDSALIREIEYTSMSSLTTIPHRFRRRSWGNRHLGRMLWFSFRSWSVEHCYV